MPVECARSRNIWKAGLQFHLWPCIHDAFQQRLHRAAFADREDLKWRTGRP
jgi:hypothetical protein